MSLVLTWDSIVNALSGVALVAFGVWVLTLKPRNRATVALAVFAGAFGAYFLPDNLIARSAPPGSAAWFPLVLAGLLGVAALALLIVGLEVPEPGSETSRRRFAAPAAAALVHFVGVWAALAVQDPGVFAAEVVGPATARADLPLSLALVGHVSVFVFVLYALADRFRTDADRRGQAWSMSLALVLYPGVLAGSLLQFGVAFRDAFALWRGVATLAALYGVGAVWLWNTATADADRSADARNLALLCFGIPAASYVFSAVLLPTFNAPAFGPHWGVSRMLGVLVLGYAILRYELLGIEAKFRWGVSKTTVAGVFVAVFFVVSEGAQALLGDIVGNEFLGILAAGALLFALAPIQKAADRIAETAVPRGDDEGDGGQRRRDIYRSTVERFLEDGKLDDEEAQELADLAEELGVGAGEAMRIRREVRDRRADDAS